MRSLEFRRRHNSLRSDSISAYRNSRSIFDAPTQCRKELTRGHTYFNVIPPTGIKLIYSIAIRKHFRAGEDNGCAIDVFVVAREAGKRDDFGYINTWRELHLLIEDKTETVALRIGVQGLAHTFFAQYRVVVDMENTILILQQCLFVVQNNETHIAFLQPTPRKSAIARKTFGLQTHIVKHSAFVVLAQYPLQVRLVFITTDKETLFRITPDIMHREERC